MKISAKEKRSATVLVEMLMSVACGLLILAAVIASGVALQRSSAAVESYSVAEGDQLRVLDYIAMDSRRCYSATVTPGTLTFTVPNFYDPNGNPVNPTFNSNGAIQYGNLVGMTSVSYSKDVSGNFVRTVTPPGQAGTSTVVARNVSTFTITPQDLTTNVTCSITFSPKFTDSPSAGTAGTNVYCNVFLRNARARE